MNTQQPKQFKILLVGDNCIDELQYGYVDRISPEAPVPVFCPTYKETRPGMAANVQTNLEALGCIVFPFMGPESIKTRLIDERSGQQIVRIDHDVVGEELPFDQLFSINVDAVVISDYNKGYVSYDLVEKLRINYHGPIFVDTKKTDLARFEGCVIKINMSEFNKLTTQPSEYTDLIVTCGDKGVVWGGSHFPGHAVEVADVTGAGDTFLSALTYEYLNSGDMAAAIEFANKAASITVQHRGVYAPRLEEIE